jgi:hypothetical protein
MREQVICQDCKHYKAWLSTWARDAPKCPNPDGIVHGRIPNNCVVFVPRGK